MDEKTTFLVTGGNPKGWTIEALLTEVQNDMVKRCTKIIDDQRPEARAVLNNNIDILAMLNQCIAKAQDSTRILNRLGRHVDGRPRIGVP